MSKTRIIVGTVLIALSLVLGACTPVSTSTPEQTTPAPSPTPMPTPTLKEVELKYDDGRSDGFQAIGSTPGHGHLVQFSPPATPFTITKVNIFGHLYGTGYENLTFTVQVWDRNLKEVYSASYPHAKFALSPGWVEIEIPRIMVEGDFYIHVFTHSPREGGINIGYDSSIKNEHSEMTRNFKIVWWGTITKETTNWMIRVIGTTISPD